MHSIRKCVEDSREDLQIVIAGAGFDPLGIELVELYPRIRVFELDTENMTAKSAMVSTTNDEICRRISFIEADLLNSPKVHEELSFHGWDQLVPTLLVLEGISYYLPTNSIQKLVHTLHPDSVIFEFLKKDRDIAIDRLPIPQRVFGLISELCGLSLINKFDRMQVENLFSDMPVEDRYGMNQLEKMRTGTNTFFSTEDSGWIEVCLLKSLKSNQRKHQTT